MDFARNRAWFGFVVAVAYVAASLMVQAQISSVGGYYTNSTANDWHAVIGNPVNLVIPAGQVTYVDIADGSGYVLRTGTISLFSIASAGGSFNVNSMHKVLWTGLPLTEGGSVTGSATTPIMLSLSYKVGSLSAPAIPIELTFPTVGAITVTKDANTAVVRAFNNASQNITLGATAATGGYGMNYLRKELMLLLDNKTGVDQVIKWGDKLLTLAPGMNQLRYDGEVDSNGFPRVAPSDFAGTAFSGSDGTNYVAANIVGSGLDSGEVKFSSPMGVPPATPTAGKDTIEVITPATPTKGATIAIHHASGGTTLTTLATSPPQTASNTTGSGAVLSNPTVAKPTQTAGNTSTGSSATNNTANNSTTIINNNGTFDKDSSGPPASYSSGNLSGVSGEATANADGVINSIKTASGKATGFFSWKWWSGESASVAGSDRSWLSWRFQYSPTGFVDIVIPDNWVNLIRAVLLWVIRIAFVMGVIKLFMK